MIDPEQFRKLVIRPTLQGLGLHSLAAERLLLGTALIESGLEFLTQHNGGPARGVYQIEPWVARDLDRTWLSFRPEWQRRLDTFDNPEQPDADELVWDLAFATAVARLIYYRRPEPLPGQENLNGLALYWKDHFNTRAGAGTAAKFVKVVKPLWGTAAFRDAPTEPPARPMV